MEMHNTVATNGEQADAVPQKTVQPQDADPSFYRSQKEVDAAFARRIEAERRKWALQHEAAQGTSAQPSPNPTTLPEAPVGPPAAGKEQVPNDAVNPAAERIPAGEADIQQALPGVDMERLIAAISRRAEDEAIERIRSRNRALPDVLRSGGSAGSLGPDYVNMPSEQFSKLKKAYEDEMRRGKKVKP